MQNKYYKANLFGNDVYLHERQGVVIKRPLFTMAVVLYLSIISAAVGKIWSVPIIFIAVLAYLHFYIRAKKVSRLNYLYALFYLIFYFYAAHKMQPSAINPYIDEFNKTDSVVKGTVKSVEKSSFGVNIKLVDCDVNITAENVLEDDLSEESTSLKNSSVENMSSQSISAQNLGLLVSVYDDNLSADCIEGAVIEVKGMLKVFNSVRNKGQFDAKTYYKSIGIDYRMTADEITVVKKSEQFNYYIKALRDKLENIYASIMDEKDASAIKAVVLGDKTGLDEEMYSLYQKNGIAHLLAISGLHISFIGMLVYRFMRRLGINYATSFCISSLFLAVYLIMTGNGISAKRAVIMCMINMGADVLGRNYDILSALSLAAIIAALENVNVIYNSGFLLSFGAMLGIALLSPVLDRMFLSEYRKKTEDYDRKMYVIKRYLRKSVEIWCGSLITSISVSLMTLPVILYQYFQVPIYSVLLNLIVIPIMSLLLFAAIIAVIAGIFSIGAAAFIIGVAHYILKFYTMLCNIFEKLPGNILVTGQPDLEFCVIYYVLLAVFIIAMNISMQKKSVRNNKYVLCKDKKMLAVLAFAVVLLLPKPNDRLLVDMIDVGQGDSIFVRNTNGTTLLFDGGSTDIKNVGEKRIFPYLRANAVKCIDYVLVSHSDSDHISGILELIDFCDETFSIKNLVMPDIRDKQSDENYQQLINKAQSAGINIIYSDAGDYFVTQDSELKITCLHPQKDYNYQSVNDYSAVYFMEYKGFSMLFTGDIEDSAEMTILDNYSDILERGVSVLKVAHHGSRYSSTAQFLEQVKPKVAIISCGQANSYGHPHDETLERLENIGAKIYVTAECGQITMEVGN